MSDLISLIVAISGFVTGLGGLIGAFVLVRKARSEISVRFQERDKARAITDQITAKTIQNLHEQIGTASKAEGALRDELKRLHVRDEEQQTEIVSLHQENAAYAETIASLAAQNEHLILEKRQAAAEAALWQKKYIDAEVEKQALNELVSKIQKELNDLHGKVANVENVTGEIQRHTQELKKK